MAFDRIDSALANTSDKYLLKNVFGGKTCSINRCKNCNNVNSKYEDFYNLSLEVKNQTSIYDGLKKFISPDIISDYQCESCKQRADLERRTVIHSLPNTLIVHLQRIVFDFETMRNSKLNSKVEFPNVLNLRPFMLESILQTEKLERKMSKRSVSEHQEELETKEIELSPEKKGS